MPTAKCPPDPAELDRYFVVRYKKHIFKAHEQATGCDALGDVIRVDAQGLVCFTQPKPHQQLTISWDQVVEYTRNLPA